MDNIDDCNFCICGKQIDINELNCGEQGCIEKYEDFQNQVNDFFSIIESKGFWEAYKNFENYTLQLQVRILYELEDEPSLLFLQALGQDKVLKLLQLKSDVFRYRFLELLDPLLEKEILLEYQSKENFDNEEIKEFLLYIINILLTSIQTNS
jgi:hypothetical protein